VEVVGAGREDPGAVLGGIGELLRAMPRAIAQSTRVLTAWTPPIPVALARVAATPSSVQPDQRHGEPEVLYLDLVHELVHVRQIRDGLQVYHFPEPYVDWPTEQEAYRITYEEAKRLGLSDRWFWEYLSVPWIDDEEIATLAKAIGMPETRVPPTDEREDSQARH
jgi:hypothetical protein